MNSADYDEKGYTVATLTNVTVPPLDVFRPASGPRPAIILHDLGDRHVKCRGQVV
jgi:hypothetical protein